MRNGQGGKGGRGISLNPPIIPLSRLQLKPQTPYPTGFK